MKPPYVFRAPKVEALSANLYIQGREKEISFWIEHYNDGRVEGGDEADIVCCVRNDRQ